MILKQKTAIITGCNRGIGKATLDIFAKTFLLPEINHLIDLGYKVEIACSQNDNKSALQGKGYKVHTISADRKISFFSNLLTSLELYTLIKNNKYDIVHTHNHVIGIIGRIVAKIAGVKNIIHTVHGFYFHENMNRVKYLFYHTVERFTAYFTDIILSENNEDIIVAKNTHL